MEFWPEEFWGDSAFCPMEFCRDEDVCRVFVVSFNAGPPGEVLGMARLLAENTCDSMLGADGGGAVNILASLSPIPALNTFLDGSLAVKTLDSSN